MNRDVMIFLTRTELEFIKNEIINAATENCEGINKEWVKELAAKLVEACENSDRTLTA